MEKINSQSAVEIFNSPKKTFRLLDKIFKRDGSKLSIYSQGNGIYSVVDDLNTEVCSTNSVYNCLVGFLYFNYGIGKTSNPNWLKTDNEDNDRFDEMLGKINDYHGFSKLEKTLDKGGSFHYNSEQSSVSFKLPEEYGFSQDVAFRCSSFSDGLEQMETTLAMINQNEMCQQ